MKFIVRCEFVGKTLLESILHIRANWGPEAFGILLEGLEGNEGLQKELSRDYASAPKDQQLFIKKEVPLLSKFITDEHPIVPSA